MTGTYFTVIAVALGVILGCSILFLAACAGALFADARARRRDRQRPRDSREDEVEAWLEPIPTWFPSLAPRNGDPFDDDSQELGRS